MNNYLFNTALTKPLLCDLDKLRLKHDRFEAIDIKQKGPLEYDIAKYWYRAMPTDEYQMLEVKNRLYFMDNPAKSESYGGIATNYNYVSNSKGYFGAHHPAVYIVEFETPSPGYLYKMFTAENIVAPKPEGDGGSYGLGPKGTNHLGHEVIKGKAGLLFNNMLARGNIKWRVVAVKTDYMENKYKEHMEHKKLLAKR
ncbi:hypothetical protein [Rahnella]|uniref:hypothetical protein n=1 Tax=Rahnella TaxID=34037 RepID=UPI00103F9A1D|nr:hypothetical protein [Rahnella]TBX36180.1 hypothetical protein EYY67_06425 [Rahnella victoriana]TDS97853.1 hypothetical protein EDF78_101228 [Rahnella sp. BIGb0236]